MKPLPRPYCTDAEYREPGPLASAIETPITDPRWQSRVLNGYIKTKLSPAKNERGVSP